MAHIFNVCAVSTDKNIYVIDVVAYSSLFNEHAILFLFIGLLLFIAILGSVIITAPFHSKHIS